MDIASITSNKFIFMLCRIHANAVKANLSGFYIVIVLKMTKHNVYFYVRSKGEYCNVTYLAEDRYCLLGRFSFLKLPCNVNPGFFVKFKCLY